MTDSTDPPNIDLRDSWNRIAAHYQRQTALRQDVVHYGVFAPTEEQLGLIGPVAGLDVLELGCGGGQCSVAFAKGGARCVGVDQSEEQLAFARTVSEVQEVQVAWLNSEMGAFLDGAEACSFDLVFSAYAFQYIADLPSLMRGISRALRPGGMLVFSLDHPLCDVCGLREGQVVFGESYFASGPREWTWEFPGVEDTPRFVSYHRTVGEIVEAVAAAGLTVERLVEPEAVSEDDPWAGPEEFERFSVIPATIIVKARRLGESSAA